MYKEVKIQHCEETIKDTEIKENKKVSTPKKDGDKNSSAVRGKWKINTAFPYK